jgi:hypothetical protein
LNLIDHFIPALKGRAMQGSSAPSKIRPGNTVPVNEFYKEKDKEPGRGEKGCYG